MNTVQALFDLYVEGIFHRVSSQPEWSMCSQHSWLTEAVNHQVEKEQQAMLAQQSPRGRKKSPLRLGDLHLSSLNVLCKYFLAHDKQMYGRLIPL